MTRWKFEEYEGWQDDLGCVANARWWIGNTTPDVAMDRLRTALKPVHVHDFRWRYLPDGYFQNEMGRVQCIAPDCPNEGRLHPAVTVASPEDLPKYNGPEPRWDR